jgi:MFS superfamily sulfate permease-like transporter
VQLLVAVRVVVGRLARTVGSVLQTLRELLEQKSAFETHLHDCSIQAGFALASGIVGLFDVV